MLKICAYINFKHNNCAAAMAFYQTVLGGQLSLTFVKESPMKEMFPAEVQDGVLHADLTGDDFSLLGTDMPDKNIEALTGAVSLTLTCATKTEVQEKFDTLGQGGKVLHPVMEFYAGTMGNVADKFGIRWGIFTEEK